MFDTNSTKRGQGQPIVNMKVGEIDELFVEINKLIPVRPILRVLPAWLSSASAGKQKRQHHQHILRLRAGARLRLPVRFSGQDDQGDLRGIQSLHGGVLEIQPLQRGNTGLGRLAWLRQTRQHQPPETQRPNRQRVFYGNRQPAYLFNWTDIQKIDHAVLHIANGQNKVLFDF